MTPCVIFLLGSVFGCLLVTLHRGLSLASFHISTTRPSSPPSPPSPIFPTTSSMVDEHVSNISHNAASEKHRNEPALNGTPALHDKPLMRMSSAPIPALAPHPTQTELPIHFPTPTPPPNEPNIFISLALKNIRDSSDIVLFSGKTTKRLLDRPLVNLTDMVSLNGQVRTHLWSDIAALVNKTFSNPNYLHSSGRRSAKAVHVHNEHKLGDFLEHAILQHRKTLRGSKRNKRVFEPPSKDELHAVLDARQPPIVITNSADENWGFLSTGIGTRTTMWINMTNHLLIHGASYETVRHFLDSDKIVLIVCNTHVDPLIGAHEKIIALPLGISRKGPVLEMARFLSDMKVKKKTLLQINNSGWGDRAFINRIVSAAFNGTVQNTYEGANTDETRSTAKKKRNAATTGRRRQLLSQGTTRNYYKEAAEAKFVLCPSGLGYDTYRLWETLLMGSIPIVETNAGFDRTYSNLPVLVVRNFSDVTPQLLNRAYPCFVANAAKYQYAHLTEQYWLEIISRAVITGSIRHIKEQHPFVNKYCNYLRQSSE